MHSRSARRAATKAGKRCTICGEPFVAKRSTRVYCGDACKVKASRHGLLTDSRPVLSQPQSRVMQALSNFRVVALTRAQIAERPRDRASSSPAAGGDHDLRGQFSALWTSAAGAIDRHIRNIADREATQTRLQSCQSKRSFNSPTPYVTNQFSSGIIRPNIRALGQSAQSLFSRHQSSHFT